MKKDLKSNTRYSRDYVTILGIKLDSAPKEKLLNTIGQKLAHKQKFYIVTPNPEIILQAQNNPILAHSLNSADFSLPDGVGLKLANQSLSIIKGRQFMLDLLQIAQEKKLKVFLLGGREVVNKKALAVITSKYPNILLSGAAGPILDSKAKPVSQVDIDLQFEIVKKINSIKPDLLFVAFGAPKQEIWIANWLDKLSVTGVMAVGGSLDYLAGAVKPVPPLFERLNLEWLWRLIQEPKRAKRIFSAVIVFPLKILLSKTTS